MSFRGGGFENMDMHHLFVRVMRHVLARDSGRRGNRVAVRILAEETVQPFHDPKPDCDQVDFFKCIPMRFNRQRTLAGFQAKQDRSCLR